MIRMNEISKIQDDAAFLKDMPANPETYLAAMALVDKAVRIIHEQLTQRADLAVWAEQRAS